MGQGMDALAAGSRIRQTPKSIATRRRVVEAATACFIEIGYHRTNTAEIAKRAGLTRGAVQYYFPTTADVLSSTAEHIAESFSEDFEARLAAIPPDADVIDSSVDVLWEICRGDLWVAWSELAAASRTDPDLRAVLEPVSDAFVARQEQVARAVFKNFQDADPRLFDLGRMISWQVLQGLSLTRFGGSEAEEAAAKQRLVDALKDLMHGIWSLPKGAGSASLPRPFWAPAAGNLPADVSVGTASDGNG